MEVKNNKLFLGGVSAEDLVKEYGSPLYAYEENTIRGNYRKLVEAISYKPKKIMFACKANTNLAIMKILKEVGCGIDAVSPGEVFLALEAGFKKEDILFTGNNMNDEDMDYVASKGVLLNIGSISRLQKYAKKYPNTDVCIRVSPDVKPNVHPHLATGGLDSKFGIYMGDVGQAQKICKDANINIKGIHSHIGTTIMDLAPFQETMDVVLEAAKEFEGIDFVDFGGGIGIPYKPEDKAVDLKAFGKFATEKMEKFSESYGKKVAYHIEPGRYLVAQSGFLLSYVNTVKQNPKKRFLGLDANMAHLVRPSMYDSYHHIYNASNMDGKTEKVDVVGNICETGDFFAKDREVAHAEEGDTIAICDAGAYGYSMSSEYNSFPKPAEVLVDAGNSRIIRERWELEDFLWRQKY
jgi:diaminopimelate decarboxylase